jgi:hypothetical protein
VCSVSRLSRLFRHRLVALLSAAVARGQPRDVRDAWLLLEKITAVAEARAIAEEPAPLGVLGPALSREGSGADEDLASVGLLLRYCVASANFSQAIPSPLPEEMAERLRGGGWS